jgi:hypothetical protein
VALPCVIVDGARVLLDLVELVLAWHSLHSHVSLHALERADDSLADLLVIIIQAHVGIVGEHFHRAIDTFWRNFWCGVQCPIENFKFVISRGRFIFEQFL